MGASWMVENRSDADSHSINFKMVRELESTVYFSKEQTPAYGFCLIYRVTLSESILSQT